MSAFDPFSDAQPTPAHKPVRHEPAIAGDGFDPWGDAPANPAAGTRHGLELPRDAPGLGSMWGETDQAESTGPSDENAGRRGGRILVVCTGNVCRSPYIHLRLAHDLADLGIEVESAGTGALVDRPVDSGSTALLDAIGVDSASFRARQLTAALVQEADLVLTATRMHRRQVVQEVPAALRKTFALTDFADLVEGLQPDDIEHVRGRSLVARVAAAAADRHHLVHARTDEDADIIDPFRRSPDVFAEMEGQLREPLVKIEHATRQCASRAEH